MDDVYPRHLPFPKYHVGRHPYTLHAMLTSFGQLNRLPVLVGVGVYCAVLSLTENQISQNEFKEKSPHFKQISQTSYIKQFYLEGPLYLYFP